MSKKSERLTGAFDSLNELYIGVLDALPESAKRTARIRYSRK